MAKKPKPPVHRNAFALHAKKRPADPLKDRREPRKGAKNEQRELLEEAEPDNK